MLSFQLCSLLCMHVPHPPQDNQREWLVHLVALTLNWLQVLYNLLHEAATNSPEVQSASLRGGVLEDLDELHTQSCESWVGGWTLNHHTHPFYWCPVGLNDGGESWELLGGGGGGVGYWYGTSCGVYIYIYIWCHAYTVFYTEPAKLPDDARVKSSRVHSSSLLCTLLLCSKYIHSPNWLLSLNAMLSFVDNVLRLSSWCQDGEASAGADPGASDVELSMREAGLQQVQKGFQLDLVLGAKEHLVLPLVALKHLQLVVVGQEGTEEARVGPPHFV